jgi:uncharacterized membrane protein YoaK (UPF0700 family)
MQLLVTRLLSANAGFIDSAAYLALKGLFAAHVTGNFVTLGAALVMGNSGVLAKLLALPVFGMVVLLARLSSYSLRARSLPVVSTLLGAQLALLILGAVLVSLFGPFGNPDGYDAVVTGMIFVSAMAIQNAAHRVHPAHAPPSTAMTGTTTQIMMDLGDVIHGLVPEKAKAIRERLARLTMSVLAFAVGCTLGALLYARVNVVCFWIPPALVLSALFMRKALTDADTYDKLPSGTSGGAAVV